MAGSNASYAQQLGFLYNQSQAQLQAQQLASSASGGRPASGQEAAAFAHPDYSDHSIAGLVEAATAAAGHEGAWAQVPESDAGNYHQTRHSERQSDRYQIAHTDPALLGEGESAEQQLAQFHGEGETNGGQYAVPEADMDTRKRKRGEDAEGMPSSTSPKEGGLDARSTDIHSAAVLFREPSKNSKKYTRPPMAKLFTSLEQTPENFLLLQAEAKKYMLNDEYPERRDCVGQRGKGDSEMVKLRLWNCVKAFLENEGNGERFFNAGVESGTGSARTLIWPEMAHNVISAVIPLLRRMVTNERQRRYAVETRKGGGDEQKKRRTSDKNEEQSHATTMAVDNHADDLQQLINNFTIPLSEAAAFYDTLNTSSILDNLHTLSGLSESDFRNVVATVEGHMRNFYHYSNPADNDSSSIETTHRILDTGLLDHADWHAGPAGSKAAKHDL